MALQPEAAEIMLDIVTNDTTGEMRVQLTVPGHLGIMLDVEAAKNFNLGICEAIAYINANQVLKFIPDNVVQLKH